MTVAADVDVNTPVPNCTAVTVADVFIAVVVVAFSIGIPYLIGPLTCSRFNPSSAANDVFGAYKFGERAC